MNRRLKQFDRLEKVAEARKQMALAELLRTKLQRVRVEHELSELSRHTAASLAAGDISVISGWLRWVDQRRAQLNSELAILSAKHENALTLSRTEWGRSNALCKLTAKAKLDHRRSQGQDQTS